MSTPEQPKKILVIRNDKIGDFMLAWPSFALLKSQYPQAEITALVPNYTAPLAEQCEWIDRVLIDDKRPSFFSDIKNLSKNIRLNKYDLSISLFSETRTSFSLWLANVKLRTGPATKIAQIFLNDRLRQKRSESSKAEYEYNLDLIKHYIKKNGDSPVPDPEPPFLRFDEDETAQLKRESREEHGIAEDVKIIILHPGSGGSAINLSIDKYAELITKLSELSQFYFIITAGPGELPRAASISERIKTVPHFVYESASGIIDFCKFINTCDLFISGSTGPLHIAGALDVCTTAFYPSKKSASPVRWETLNSPQHRLAISGTSTTDSAELFVDIDETAQKVFRKFFARGTSD